MKRLMRSLLILPLLVGLAAAQTSGSDNSPGQTTTKKTKRHGKRHGKRGKKHARSFTASTATNSD